ncbi:hypothetical protein [Nonomuraea polychroma]|uniref:hypothetical protein n=1 Tax=Nonomuraea polychroma TaxID=46176 RepID=UPI000FDD99D3|nr:hypothetical protein [Nonomuraea polychroma]
MNVLGIDVESSLVQRWARWLAPACQPFFLTAGEVVELGLTPDRPQRALSAELRDTYEVWNLPKGSDVVWLDGPAFHALPRPVRAELVRAQLRHGRGAVPAISGWADVIDAQVLREQADGHHFVWWPALVEPRAEAVLERILLDDGHLPCRRTSVPVDVWRAAASTLPHARALSGTFANGSGANCFGTVMAAAGVQEAAETWMLQEPFEAWLAANCTEGGRDDLPGTVLVWRAGDRTGQHAAVTLGGGWGLHKPSQSWATPRQVLTVHDLIRTAPPGVTLHRYSLRDLPALTLTGHKAAGRR